MQTKVGNLARYKILKSYEGNRYQFFCEISGALVYTSGLILLNTPEQELKFAWENEGKKHFNMCQQCGRWVSDAVYNVETLECVECSPWEEEPLYCPHCGEKVQPGDFFCERCRKRLKYGKPVEENK